MEAIAHQRTSRHHPRVTVLRQRTRWQQEYAAPGRRHRVGRDSVLGRPGCAARAGWRGGTRGYEREAGGQDEGRAGLASGGIAGGSGCGASAALEILRGSPQGLRLGPMWSPSAACSAIPSGLFSQDHRLGQSKTLSLKSAFRPNPLRLARDLTPIYPLADMLHPALLFSSGGAELQLRHSLLSQEASAPQDSAPISLPQMDCEPVRYLHHV